ncbi:TPA: hypothetical protein L4T50_004959 [Pseudomonas aeruginosa]|uniref:hypothetical protein n=1 Tax=Pseudomonas aeruginosa TaxID=287 RepID=UPI0024ACBD4B|nr:hypothetical protein [Pseudomonas aeruginosa]MDI3925847.1 hypothetical protein [Pseudomonas aeruginosa]HBO3923926.1 hypothetical protein [Pseudomonas aeruginosa]
MIRKAFTVSSISIDDVMARFPQLTEIEKVSDEIDILICAAGFEDRVLCVPGRISESHEKIRKKILVGQYKTNISDNARRYAVLEPLLAGLCEDISFFNADSPDCIYKAISAEISNAGDGVKIGLDISGASSTLIVSAIYTVLNHSVDSHLTIFYATAESYHEPSLIDRDVPINLWSSCDYREHGVNGVEVNELMPGLHQESNPTYVIAFPSMFSARLERCLGHLGVVPKSGSENSAFWVLPSAANDEHEWRQRQAHSIAIDLVYGTGEDAPVSLPDERWCSCDALDYKGSAKILYGQIDGNSGSNISIVHLGTKAQAIGVALALSGRGEVAFVNARPLSFSADTYSQGVGKLYKLDLGSSRVIKDLLSSVGSLCVKSL